MTDDITTPAQGTTPLWSDTQVTKAAHHNSQHISYYSSALHALRQMRDDYEADRQRLIAEADQLRAELYEMCERCEGRGFADDGKGFSVTCPDCEGTGGVKMSIANLIARIAELERALEEAV